MTKEKTFVNIFIENKWTPSYILIIQVSKTVKYRLWFISLQFAREKIL